MATPTPLIFGPSFFWFSNRGLIFSFDSEKVGFRAKCSFLSIKLGYLLTEFRFEVRVFLVFGSRFHSFFSFLRFCHRKIRPVRQSLAHLCLQGALLVWPLWHGAKSQLFLIDLFLRHDNASGRLGDKTCFTEVMRTNDVL